MSLKLYPARSISMTSYQPVLFEEVRSEIEDEEMALRQYEILTYPADFTLEVLVSKWGKNEIRKTEFQRRYVWNHIRASKLIESFLLGLPVPPVFFYQDRDDSGLLVVDGHQRLRTLIYFFSGWFGDEESGGDIVPFKLIGLNEKSPYLGATYDSLKINDISAWNRLNSAVLRSFIMKQLTPDDDTSIFQVFERLNTGGMILQGQEIRNCIYEGEFNSLLKRLNKIDAWRQILGTKTEDKRMRDLELILRFFALFYNLKDYEKPMKGFLNKFMRANRRPPLLHEGDEPEQKKEVEKKRKEFSDKMNKFEGLFTSTAELVVKYLGAKPFHIHNRGINAAVFDSVFTAFAHHFNGRNSNEINPTPEEIASMNANYKALRADKNYQFWILAATTDKDVVPKRIDRARRVLFK